MYGCIYKLQILNNNKGSFKFYFQKRNQDKQKVRSILSKQLSMNNASCYFSTQLVNLYPMSNDSSTSGCSNNMQQRAVFPLKYREVESRKKPQQIYDFHVQRKFSTNYSISQHKLQHKTSKKINRTTQNFNNPVDYLKKQNQSIQGKTRIKTRSKSQEKIRYNSLRGNKSKSPKNNTKKQIKINLNNLKSNQNKRASNSSYSSLKKKKNTSIHFKKKQKDQGKPKIQEINISKDYLLLGQSIFECQDMDVRDIVQQILGKGSSPNLFSYERYYKSVSGNINKIEKYLRAFLDDRRFNLQNASRKTSLLQTYGFKNQNTNQNETQQFDIDLERMTAQQKEKLYQLLLKQQQCQKHQQRYSQFDPVKNHPCEQQCECQTSRIQIDQILQNTLKALQERYQKFRNQTKQSQTRIKLEKWKNQKMHQLLSAKQLLAQSLSQNAKNFDQYFSLQTQQVFEKQLQQLIRKANQSYNFKEIKGQTRNLCRQLRKHLQLQKYPQRNVRSQRPSQTKQIKITIQNQVYQKKRDKSNFYFGNTGFFNYLNNLRQFIKHNETYMNQFLISMQKPFGYQSTLKYQLMRIHQNDWWDLIQYYESTVQMGPISRTIYLQFAQKIIGTGETMQQIEQKQCIHIFNRALLEAFNASLNKYRIFYPNGVCLPYVSPHKLTEYSITEDNFDDIWDTCIASTHQSVQLMAGIIYEPKNQQRNSQIQNQFLQLRDSEQSQLEEIIPMNVRYHRTQKLKQFLILQIKQEQAQYYSMKYLALGQVNFELQNAVEAILYHETAILLRQITQKRQNILC